jgi:hypothetical protein
MELVHISEAAAQVLGHRDFSILGGPGGWSLLANGGDGQTPAFTESYAAIEQLAGELADKGPVPASISRRQLLLALAQMGLISGEEALAAAQTGAVPAAVQAVFDNMQPADKLSAQITWASMSVAERDHPLVLALAQANDMSAGEIDDFFRLAASL